MSVALELQFVVLLVLHFQVHEMNKIQENNELSCTSELCTYVYFIYIHYFSATCDGGRPANRYNDVAGRNPCPVYGFVK